MLLKLLYIFDISIGQEILKPLPGPQLQCSAELLRGWTVASGPAAFSRYGEGQGNPMNLVGYSCCCNRLDGVYYNLSSVCCEERERGRYSKATHTHIYTHTYIYRADMFILKYEYASQQKTAGFARLAMDVGTFKVP